MLQWQNKTKVLPLVNDKSLKPRCVEVQKKGKKGLVMLKIIKNVCHKKYFETF